MIRSFLPVLAAFHRGELAWVDVLVEAETFDWRNAAVNNHPDGSLWPQPGTFQELDAAEDYGWITAEQTDQLYDQFPEAR